VSNCPRCLLAPQLPPALLLLLLLLVLVLLLLLLLMQCMRSCLCQLASHLSGSDAAAPTGLER
jgi:hypothetical protein